MRTTRVLFLEDIHIVTNNHSKTCRGMQAYLLLFKSGSHGSIALSALKQKKEVALQNLQ